jgi:hypothetical protein
LKPKKMEDFFSGFKRRKNPYDERFWRNLIEQSQKKSPRAITEWAVDHITNATYFAEDEAPSCICGKQGIVDVYILKNKENGNRITVGSCCVRRWQGGLVIPSWRRKENYLERAMLMARNNREREFIRGLLSKCVKYEKGVIVTQRQKAWLESITGHPWRGKVWKRHLDEFFARDHRRDVN